MPCSTSPCDLALTSPCYADLALYRDAIKVYSTVNQVFNRMDLALFFARTSSRGSTFSDGGMKSSFGLFLCFTLEPSISNF